MQSDRLTHDVLIIGAGPSGISTALHLAQLAPQLAQRTLVLEKAHHPRPKLCAGGLVVDAEVILARLGLDTGEIPHTDARAAHFDFEGRGLKLRLSRRHTLRIVRRDEFDAWLTAKARQRGITVEEGVSVQKVIPGGADVTVETDRGVYHARVVVGADGSNGVVRRCILPGSPIYTARVLEVLAAPQTGNGHEACGAYFDFIPVPNGIAGYTWDFPTQVGGRPMRCWGIYDANLFSGEKRPALKEVLDEEMARHGLHLGDYELKGHPIRWFDPANDFAVPGVLLVGDAAGADPFFGEGISMALGYGRLAAQSIRHAFSKDDFSFRDYRRRVLLSSLGRALIVRWFITYFLYGLRWRWFQVFIWRVLKPLVVLISMLFVVNWAKRS